MRRKRLRANCLSALEWFKARACGAKALVRASLRAAAVCPPSERASERAKELEQLCTSANKHPKASKELLALSQTSPTDESAVSPIEFNPILAAMASPSGFQSFCWRSCQKFVENFWQTSQQAGWQDGGHYQLMIIYFDITSERADEARATRTSR